VPSRRELARLAADIPRIEDAIGMPIRQWAGQCHGVSLAILRTGIFGRGRVARGSARGVMSQHSWIVLGDSPETTNVYAQQGDLIDPTWWWYTSPERPYIWVGSPRNGHTPHGAGSIWRNGKPPEPTGPVITLEGVEALSREAQHFLSMCGPLDYRGWAALAHGPMEGWPAGEILEAMLETRELKAVAPIDRIGMLTTRNPSGLYW